MNQFELLAAKIRGCDSNAEAAKVIVKYTVPRPGADSARKLAQESAQTLRENAANVCPGSESLYNQIISNFETISGLLAEERTSDNDGQ